MSVAGERGVLLPQPSAAVEREAGDFLAQLPANLLRKQPPLLPEVSQMRVNRHYLRLSQETLGADVTIDISQGTCTMKYSPKVQEHLTSRNPNLTEIHPLQPPLPCRGFWRFIIKWRAF